MAESNPLPSKRAFLTLVALFRSESGPAPGFATVPASNEMYSLQPDGTLYKVGDELDELLGRGWVELVGDRIHVTDRGRYWLGRYRKNRTIAAG